MTSVVIDLETAQDLGLGILLEEARAAGGELKLVDNSNQVIATLRMGDDSSREEPTFTSKQLNALEAVRTHGAGIQANKRLRELDSSLGLKEAKLLIDWAARRLSQS